MKVFYYELKAAPLLMVLVNIMTSTAEKHLTNHHHHKITRRSPLEIGYIVGVTSPDASHHQIVVPHHEKGHVIVHHQTIIHHDVLPTTAHGNSLVVVAAKTKIIPVIKTDTHVITHDVVVHEHQPLVVHDTHVVIHDVKPHVLHETHVISHDTKALGHPPVLHDIVLIPIGHGHTVTLKHHDVIDEDPLRSHPGGYGVGVDFGGHGAGHGFYVNQNNNFF